MSSGAVRVGIGLGFFGLSSYAFLAIAARQLTPANFAVLSTLWVLVYTGGPGVFLPFEQAIGRAAAMHRADPVEERAVFRMLVVASAVAVAALLLIALAFHGVLVRHLFGGSESTFVALLLSLIGMWGAYVTRGVFAGHDRYTAYGVQLAVEGVARIVLGAIAVWLAWSLAGFALGLAVALLVSVLVTLRAAGGGHRREFETTVATEDSGHRTQLRILGWLILGGLGMQVLVNIGPVIAQATSDGSTGSAGHYLGALMLARLPLFAFAAVQAALLPGLAHTVADGDGRAFRRSLRNLFVLIGGAMVLFTLILAVAGPWLVHVVYGAGFGIHRIDLVLLAIGTGIAMLAIVAGNAVVAVGAASASAWAWIGSVAVLMVVVVLMPGSIFVRLEVSYIAGVTAALVGQLVAVFARVRAGARSDYGLGRLG
ncbi:lipopolysaccharide biosynthesis protein [Flexivirga alba]|uniref:Lipopolysaccharide biosynthesis protein n=1 Tax=Flexivirga alba TaxID=702742 RepID=A0ABW2AEF4_9MICO